MARRSRRTTCRRFQAQHAAARRRADGALPARGLRQRAARRARRPSWRRSPADPAIAEAVERLAELGLLDADRHSGGLRRARRRRRPHRPGVPSREARASVAATIYNLWRAKAIRSVIDARLSALGVSASAAGDALKALHHLLAQSPTRRRRVGRRLLPGAGGALGRGAARPRAARGAARRARRAGLARVRARLRRLDRTRTTTAGASCTASPSITRFGPASRSRPQAGFRDLAPELPGSRATAATRW